MTLLTVALLAVIVALIAVITMLLGGGPRERRGGTIDLTPAAARGELDLDWSDPRPVAIGDAEHAEVVDEWARHAGLPTAAEQTAFTADLRQRRGAHAARLTAASG